jgi:uncharacterized protein
MEISMREYLSVFLLAVSSVVYSQPDIPEHGGRWVHDLADVLSSGMESRLENILMAERDSTSNQISLLIINSLEGLGEIERAAQPEAARV